MRQEVLSAAAKRNLFLTPDAMEMILSNDHPLEFANTVFANLARNVVFVDRDDVMNCIAGDKVLFESPREIKPRNRQTSDIHVMDGTDVTGQSTCEGKINDFAQYFKSRYAVLRKLIEKRPDFGKAMEISRAKGQERDVKVVGIVYERSSTRNGHTILSVEDESDVLKVLISKDSPLAGETFVDDEVVGLEGHSINRGELFVPTKVYRPDIPRNHSWEPSDTGSKVAFLSDVHAGSCTFLENDWRRMIDWLRHNAEAEQINYIVFPGDIVDGIGVFPDQDKELNILNIDEQYAALSEYLKEIPDHIRMVVHPGNHDACRLAEPQPALNSRFTKGFDSNTLLVANPVGLEIEGRKVLTYHGKSMDDWIAAVQNLTYDDPLGVMREMCVKRHLAPIYGQRNALAPERKDYLAMDFVPDIFVSGHVHGAGQQVYNGVRMINASTWQDQTEYQKQHNFNPDPGIMPVVDLGTGAVRMRDFHSCRFLKKK